MKNKAKNKTVVIGVLSLEEIFQTLSESKDKELFEFGKAHEKFFRKVKTNPMVKMFNEISCEVSDETFRKMQKDCEFIYSEDNNTYYAKEAFKKAFREIKDEPKLLTLEQ
ncbi:MAG: hypothetical protein ABIL58_15190 [Pseudomonadota bacterium]